MFGPSLLFESALPYIAVELAAGLLLLYAGSGRRVEPLLLWLRRTTVRLGFGPKSHGAANPSQVEHSQLQRANSDVAAWIERMVHEYARQCRSLSALAFGCALYMGGLYLVLAPRLRDAGWSFDQFIAMATAATSLLALAVLGLFVPSWIRCYRIDRELRRTPGNLHADSLIRATPVDLSAYPALARLAGIRAGIAPTSTG